MKPPGEREKIKERTNITQKDKEDKFDINDKIIIGDRLRSHSADYWIKNKSKSARSDGRRQTDTNPTIETYVAG